MSDTRGSMLGRLLPFLKGGKGAVADEVTDEQQQQLLLLFEKRNELKREFGKTLDELEEVRAERDRLADAHARDSERLSGLEKLLVDPVSCQNAIIYYRLDGLWNSCRQRLLKRRDDLERKYEELERSKALEDFKAHAEQQQRQLEEKFKLVDEAYQEKADEVARLQDQLARARQLWHYFKRKRLTQAILEAEEAMAPAISKREECLAELERVRDREPPAWDGLSVRSRREINIALIALAQYLVVHYSENDLATLARSTQLKNPGDWRYGSNDECMSLLKPIRDIVGKLKADDRRQERLHRRANHLREIVSYEGNADTVPEASSVARIEPSPGASESIHAVHADIPVNVIEMNYWGLNDIMLPPREQKKKKESVVETAIAAD